MALILSAAVLIVGESSLLYGYISISVHPYLQIYLFKELL